MAMRSRIIMLFFFTGALAFAANPRSYGAALQWQKGRVLAAELNGHGANPNAKSTAARSSDIWWTYCVAIGDSTYSAVLRENPAKSGMAINSAVRAALQKDFLYVLNPEGNQLTLRVVRRGKGSACR